MKVAHLILAGGLVWAAPALADDIALTIGGHAIRVEVAATPQAREQGLMQRDHLCADCGMLFVFPAEKNVGFWMKDTRLALSIAFIARDGRIMAIAEMQPYTLDVHLAGGNALYALEMNSGWFAAYGIKPGDSVQELGHIQAR